MLRIVCIALLLSLTACGLADTATTAAAGGAAKAQEVQQAKETQEKLQGQLEQAGRQGPERVDAAEREAR